jgi:DNA (cytosine-5)-methyltransferase 1
VNPDSNGVVSLFSGAGGFDLGFRRVGFKIYLANELLKSAAETLAHNLDMTVVRTPAAPRIMEQPQVIWGDIADVRFDNASDFHPAVLIGGPPCQDYSVVQAQFRPGMNGRKGTLYSHLTRALAAFQPKVFVFENVQGLLSSDGGELYRQILHGWRTLGIRHSDKHSAQEETNCYEILFEGVVEAAKLGVPQRRNRLIVVGVRRDLAQRIGEIGFADLKRRLSAQMAGDDTLIAKFPLTCIEALEGKSLPQLADRYREVMRAYKGLWRNHALPAAAAWHEEVWKNLSQQVMLDYLRVNQIGPWGIRHSLLDQAMREHEALLEKLGWLDRPLTGIPFEDGTNDLPSATQTVQERMRMIPPGENHEFVAGTPWNVEGKGISFIYRRSFPLKPAFTVMAYGGGGTYGYHYARERDQLTLREKARLQTFPDDFVFSGSAPEIRAQIGEAVPPLMGERIALMIRGILTAVGQ